MFFNTVVLEGCKDLDEQAQEDILNRATPDPRFLRQGQFLSVFAGTFHKEPDYWKDSRWDLRQIDFKFTMANQTARWGGFFIINFLARTEKGDKEKRQH
jgi:hypothetical protein